MNNKTFDTIFHYLTGKMKTDELKAFEIWVQESDANKEIFDAIKTVWIMERASHSSSSQGKKRVWKQVMKKTGYLDDAYKKQQKVQSLKILSRAAILVIGIALGTLLTYLGIVGAKLDGRVARLQPKTINCDTIIIEANKGSRSEVLLPDRSKVWLNNGSKIKLLPEFYSGKRDVYLIGEAYFDIAKKGKNDFFRVKTSDIQIKVLGTEFNLKAYPEEGTIETTLEEGSVVIEKKVNNTPVQIARLEPNEKAVFIKKQSQISVKQEKLTGSKEKREAMGQAPRKEKLIIRENIDTKLYTSWKEGHLVFKDESFKDIITRMERWYDVTIKINDKDLENLEFTANFKNETIHQALYALKLTHPFTYTHDVEQNVIHIE